MALVPHTDDLFKEADELQRMRKEFHESCIADTEKDANAQGQRQPESVAANQTPRTLDNPTLEVLKSPNYPFLLCEEAPPAYIPPPVPFDVDGEVDTLKERVLSVQESLQTYQQSLEEKRGLRDPALSKKELLTFFSDDTEYADLAWSVSSLQWFYRWVLSHSISHLWNTKEALEYVLSANDAEVSTSPEELDECLRQYPFTQAVAILDNDRQAVIAQERRRLRSVSQTYRSRLPAQGITNVTSSYLSLEEKYMYQEFFNQSEHLLLLFNHAVLLDKAKKSHNGESKRSRSPSGSRSTNQLRRAEDCDALVRHRGDELPETGVLVDDAVGAMSAEREVIETLLQTIKERKESGTTFESAPEERERSRSAQVAVYGCVVSDMALMSQQMDAISVFLEKYEDWLKFHGFDSHDALMSELAKTNGGSRWPVMPKYNTSEGLSHTHFVPPTEQLKHRQQQQQQSFSGQERSDARQVTDERYINNLDDARRSYTSSSSRPPAEDPVQQQQQQQKRQEQEEQARLRQRNPPQQQQSHGQASRAPPAPSKQKDAAPARNNRPAGLQDSQKDSQNAFACDAADAFYTILCHVDNCLHDGSSIEGDGTDMTLDRMWLTAALRFTVGKLTIGAWNASDLRRSILPMEDALIAQLRRKSAYETLIGNASSFMFVLEELAALALAKDSHARKCTSVRVAVNKRENVNNTRKCVIYTMTPVETERWGTVLDALWFQADPTGAANGDLLNTREGSNRANGFMRIDHIALPSKSTRYMTMYYRINGTERDAQAVTLEDIITNSVLFASDEMVRLACIRRVLSALREVESKGLLPCYACRPDEIDTVSFARHVYITSDNGTEPTTITVMPPAPVQLRRVDVHVGSKSVFENDGDYESFVAPYLIPRNFSTIGLLVASLMSQAAEKSPVAAELYMTGEHVREAAIYEINCGVPNHVFAKASMHPVNMTCSPMKTRAMSIQYESVMGNRNTVSSLTSFTQPLLRQVDDIIALVEEEKDGSNDAANDCYIHDVGGGDEEDEQNRSNMYPPRPTTHDKVANGKTTSPSPSAIRPWHN